MEECVRMMQQRLRSAPTMKKRAKSVYAQRNLGTIKERKKEKREEKEVTSEETIMRILRMRYAKFTFDAAVAFLQGIGYVGLERQSSSHNSFRLCRPCKRNRSKERKSLSSEN
jgi:hypothetical protein